MVSIVGILLAAFAGFGFPAEPGTKTIPAKQAYQWVPAGSNVVAHVDAGRFLRAIPKMLKKLKAEPAIAKNQQMSMMLMMADGQVARMFQNIQRQTGINLAKDLRYVTFAMRSQKVTKKAGTGMLRYVRRKEPHIFAVFSLKIKDQQIAKVLKMMRFRGAPKIKKGWKLYRRYASSDKVLFVTPKQQIGFGNAAMVESLIQDKNDGPALAEMSPPGVPGQLVALHLNDPAGFLQDVAGKPRGGARILAPLLRQVNQFHLSLGDSLIGTHLVSKDVKSVKRFQSLLTGLGALAVAAQHASYGFLQIVDATLDPKDRRMKRELRMFAKNKDLIMRLLGKRLHPGASRYQVSTKGKQISLALQGVTGGGGLLALGAASFFFFGMRQSTMPRRRVRSRYKSSVTSSTPRNPHPNKTAPLKRGNNGFGAPESAAP